MRQATCSDTGS